MNTVDRLIAKAEEALVSYERNGCIGGKNNYYYKLYEELMEQAERAERRVRMPRGVNRDGNPFY